MSNGEERQSAGVWHGCPILKMPQPRFIPIVNRKSWAWVPVMSMGKPDENPYPEARANLTTVSSWVPTEIRSCDLGVFMVQVQRCNGSAVEKGLGGLRCRDVMRRPGGRGRLRLEDGRGLNSQHRADLGWGDWLVTKEMRGTSAMHTYLPWVPGSSGFSFYYLFTRPVRGVIVCAWSWLGFWVRDGTGNEWAHRDGRLCLLSVGITCVISVRIVNLTLGRFWLAGSGWRAAWFWPCRACGLVVCSSLKRRQ